VTGARLARNDASFISFVFGECCWDDRVTGSEMGSNCWSINTQYLVQNLEGTDSLRIMGVSMFTGLNWLRIVEKSFNQIRILYGTPTLCAVKHLGDESGIFVRFMRVLCGTGKDESSFLQLLL
jgi:hypothetical protein